jgi:hypothetical protein
MLNWLKSIFTKEPYKYVDDRKPARTPVIHRECGGQVGWYLRENPRPGDFALSRDVEYMDGKHPIPGTSPMINCPNCGERINFFQCLRISNEVKDANTK